MSNILASSNIPTLPIAGTVRQSMLEISPAALAAASGWLAGHALTLLGDRSFLDRVVGQLELNAITFDSLCKLDVDIRWTARQRRILIPELEEFLNPVAVLVFAPGYKAAVEKSQAYGSQKPNEAR